MLRGGNSLMLLCSGGVGVPLCSSADSVMWDAVPNEVC